MKYYLNVPKIVLCANIIALSASFPVAAQDAAKTDPQIADETRFLGGTVSLSVGVGAGVGTEYMGSDSYKAIFVPLVDLRWQNQPAATPIDGTDMRFGLHAVSLGQDGLQMDIGELQFGNHMITKSIGITYDGGRDADDDAALRGLGDIDGYWVGTVGVEYAPVRPTGGTFLSAGVDAAFDLSNETNGVVVEANARLNHLLSRRLRVAHGPYVTWANENHMQAYFGISAQQARRSQYQAFSAGSGIRDVGYQVVAHYGLTESLSLLGVLNYQHLLSDAADSPLVDQEGSAGQFTSFMGVTYRF